MKVQYYSEFLHFKCCFGNQLILPVYTDFPKIFSPSWNRFKEIFVKYCTLMVFTLSTSSLNSFSHYKGDCKSDSITHDQDVF